MKKTIQNLIERLDRYTERAPRNRVAQGSVIWAMLLSDLLRIVQKFVRMRVQVLFLIIIAAYSCVDDRKIVVTDEQYSALSSDTLFLDYRLGMSQVEYKGLSAIHLMRKKIEIGEKGLMLKTFFGNDSCFGIIKPTFWQDSLAVLAINYDDCRCFNEQILLETLVEKYGESKATVWESDKSWKRIKFNNKTVNYEHKLRAFDLLRQEIDSNAATKDSLKKLNRNNF